MPASDGDQASQGALAAPPMHFTIPPLAKDSIPTSDSAVAQANLEAMGLAQGSLEADASRNSHTRRESLRDIVHWVKVAFLLLIALLVFAAIIIVALHWMTPLSFLEDNQLQALHTMLTSSMITGVATVMGKNILKDI